MIERMAEEFEYCELLHQAAACDDLTRQMVYVVAFVVSSIAPTVGRTTKPFNPLLGMQSYTRVSTFVSLASYLNSAIKFINLYFLFFLCVPLLLLFVHFFSRYV